MIDIIIFFFLWFAFSVPISIGVGWVCDALEGSNGK